MKHSRKAMNMEEIEHLKKRIEDLEAEVAKLKAAQPAYVIHSHYHYAQPVYQPPWGYPQITYGGAGMHATAGAAGNG